MIRNLFSKRIFSFKKPLEVVRVIYIFLFSASVMIYSLFILMNALRLWPFTFFDATGSHLSLLLFLCLRLHATQRASQTAMAAFSSFMPIGDRNFRLPMFSVLFIYSFQAKFVCIKNFIKKERSR
ncbi:MAG: hypothetical protein LBH84_07185 [Prevotellaceae bacterium]|jgi:hypothetical protein|nr:hypothetical protein [Prevotellaceae bacterium]